MAERHPLARKDLGHTEYVQIKMHPELLAHVRDQSVASFCSVAEYIRQLIVADKRRKELERIAAEAGEVAAP